MRYTYFTDEEYDSSFEQFGNIRSKIASFVFEQHPSEVDLILDVPAGHGYHIAEFCRIYPESRQIAMGLSSDAASFRGLSGSHESYQQLFRSLEYLVCDATSMPLENDSCDLIVNFLGLEDIRMTRGEVGVRDTLAEMCRVLKKNGTLQISLVEYGEQSEERIADEVWKTIGLNAVFFSRDWFVNEMQKLTASLCGESVFTYPKKMTSQQAAEELEFACNNAPKTFNEFGVTAISFEDLWERFGERIEKHGMAFWSRIRVLLFRLGNVE